jgi:hypothetical protein
MKTYEIINPSDPYSLQSDDFILACVTVALLGMGMYGISGSPIVRGWEPFFREKDVDLDEYIPANWERLADCFDSVLVGTRTQQDREVVEFKFISQTELDREARYARWHKNKRKSANDIGAKARANAAHLRKQQGQPNHVPA